MRSKLKKNQESWKLAEDKLYLTDHGNKETILY